MPAKTFVAWATNIPEASTIRETHEAGFLPEHVTVAKWMISQGGLTPVWKVALDLNLSKRVVEKAVVSMGLPISLYNAQGLRHMGVKGTGVRRCVRANPRVAKTYLREIRDYRDARRKEMRRT